VEDVKNGISKPLLEMMISSSDEESLLNESTSGYASHDHSIQSRAKDSSSESDNTEDDEDYEENPIQ
jgi:hypothetical protein